MKYIIELEDEPMIANSFNQEVDELWKAKGFNSLVFDKYGLYKLTPYTELDRKAIEDEVWEFATTCTKMDGADSVDVFGDYSLDSFTKYSYQEVKAKYETWKKQKDEIHVGDEVQYSLAGYEYTFIVLGKENDTLYGIRSDCKDGLDDVYDGWDTCNKSDHTLVKTGRHFDEVESLLEKIRGEQE